jgi:hypothetical protein
VATAYLARVRISPGLPFPCCNLYRFGCRNRWFCELLFELLVFTCVVSFFGKLRRKYRDDCSPLNGCIESIPILSNPSKELPARMSIWRIMAPCHMCAFYTYSFNVEPFFESLCFWSRSTTCWKLNDDTIL